MYVAFGENPKGLLPRRHTPEAPAILTGPAIYVTIDQPSRKVADMQLDTHQQLALSVPASAHADSVGFGLHPRLTESWRGFYFYTFFAGQPVALHAWAEAAP